MRDSKILAKLRSGETARVCALGHFIPPYVRHAARFAFDGVWLDLEHRAMEAREVQALLAFFHLYDIDCLLRPPTLEKSRLYRYLEDGATGLMIPHVSTPEKARLLVEAVKFPPLGDRGLDGAGFDSDFALDESRTYPERANRQTLLVVQIETPLAVANVDRIAAVPGVDALFVGPGDLGLRLEKSGEGTTLEQALDRIATTADEHGKPWGLPVAGREQLAQMYDRGARLLCHGGDFIGLMRMLEQCAADFDTVAQANPPA